MNPRISRARLAVAGRWDDFSLHIGALCQNSKGLVPPATGVKYRSVYCRVVYDRQSGLLPGALKTPPGTQSWSNWSSLTVLPSPGPFSVGRVAEAQKGPAVDHQTNNVLATLPGHSIRASNRTTLCVRTRSSDSAVVALWSPELIAKHRRRMGCVGV